MTVRVKVLKTHDPQTVTTGKIKQDIIIADATGKSTVVVWESHVNEIQNHKSYQLSRVLVRLFMGKYHLSVPPTGSTIEEISDLDISHSDEDSSEDDDESITEASVVGVQSLDKFFSCLNCKKAVEPTNDVFGTCTSCNTTQKRSNPKVSAKIFIQSSKNQSPVSVRAHIGALQAITGKDTAAEITSEDVLLAPCFNLTYNK